VGKRIAPSKKAALIKALESGQSCTEYAVNNGFKGATGWMYAARIKWLKEKKKGTTKALKANGSYQAVPVTPREPQASETIILLKGSPEAIMRALRGL
jgi:hypothetical protein